MALVDVGALLAQVGDHLGRAERAGPIEQRLADVVRVVHVDGVRLDGVDERVNILLPDRVDQLPMNALDLAQPRAGRVGAEATRRRVDQVRFAQMCQRVTACKCPTN